MKNILEQIKEKYEGKYVKVLQKGNFPDKKYQGYIKSIDLQQIPYEGDFLELRFEDDTMICIGLIDTYFEITDPVAPKDEEEKNDLSKYNPGNLDHAIRTLDELQIKDEDEWLSMDEEHAVSMAHFELGRKMRNAFGLWEDNPRSELGEWFFEYGVKHPDHMSAVILHAYHRYKNGRKIKKEKLLKQYAE